RHFPRAAAAGICGARTATAAGGSFRAADADLPAGSRLGPSAGLRGAAAQQRDLHQRAQHRGRQQRDEHRDDYESERPDPDHGACGSHGGCGPAHPPLAATGGAAPPSLAPSLPPSVAQKAATLQTQAPPGGAQPSAPGSTATQPAPRPGQPLPGMKGQPLPSPSGTPATPTTPSAAITPGTSTP